MLCNLDVAVRNAFELPARVGIPSDDLCLLMGTRFLIPMFSHAACNAIYHGFAMLLMPLLLKSLVRSCGLAASVSWAIITAFLCFKFGDGTAWFAVYMGLWAIVFQGTTLYFGLLSGAAMFFTFHAILLIPFTAKQSEWYWPISLAGIMCLILVAALGLLATWPRSEKRAARSYVATL